MNEYPEDEYFQDHPASMARRRRERRQIPELDNDSPDPLGRLEDRGQPFRSSSFFPVF